MSSGDERHGCLRWHALNDEGGGKKGGKKGMLGLLTCFCERGRSVSVGVGCGEGDELGRKGTSATMNIWRCSTKLSRCPGDVEGWERTWICIGVFW
jgi:hypothetical protein